MDKIIPAKTLGIMGGGQLARMFAIAAKQMGYQIAILEPEENCPARLFANYHIISRYDDTIGLDNLARHSTVITTEFENVPAVSMEYLGQKTAVFPKHSAIAITQNRILEKNFFNSCGIKTTRYIAINTLNDIRQVPENMLPAILKTNTLGYDGKGQIIVKDYGDLEKAFKALHQVPAILEKIVPLHCEVSVMVARNQNEISCYPVVQNLHINGILDTTIAPAQIDKDIIIYIEKAAKTIIKKLDYIGILGIEFFITNTGEILANEMAPRPHNSGHYTLDACMTSQFEQQVRAVCNLKLGNTELFTNAIMLNLLGDIWPKNGTPPWDKILGKFSNIKLHLYDKKEAKIGRKMGHLTILGNDISVLYKQLNEIKLLLGINS
ncbi:MAG: 5-(carboxyamino)imidazole ribonucleotide synthase [Burkholderiales bacterium]|jgi:5-(carboxyamino)imidazole ribonucleotide synthase|nr:5-(carboxyamino)imidazole ribonucleotide synthase [Burkholderiales bacterium]